MRCGRGCRRSRSLWRWRRWCSRMLRRRGRWCSRVLWRRRRCLPRGRRYWRRGTCRRRSLWRFLGRLLGFPVRTQFFPLRQHGRRRLRVRRSGHKLHGRQRGRGKQRYSQFCHVLRVPGKFKSDAAAEKVSGLAQQTPAINEQALGRIVAGFKREPWIIIGHCAVWTRLFTTYSAPVFQSR
jgi:hypothetical protein